MAKNVDLSKRGSWRGFKLCQSCGHVQGQRQIICSNESCPLRKKILATQLPYDPIKLVSKTPTTCYSLRCKERETQPRNFVEITEVTLELEPDSTIVSRNATCYVDKCKYALNGVTCNHVKACNVDSKKSIPVAEMYSLSREVLWNLNIDIKHKQRLWEMYKEDEAGIPPIQRLNATTFAVKCIKSKVFPAGRLHVTAVSNGTAASKKTTHACMCKKLKIILEADNSVVMQEEICDHLLLVLAAILSKPNGKHIYKNFANALKSFWMPAELEKPVLTQEDAFFGLDINIGGNFGENTGNVDAADDIFIFDDKFLSNDNLPDFTDIVLDLNPNDLLQKLEQSFNTTSTSNVNALTPVLLHAGDPNLVSSCNINEEDIDMCFDDITSTTTATTTMLTSSNTIIDEVNIDSATHLELSDCNIELMDQFQLTDRIDLCSDEIDLQSNGASLFDNTSSINILANPQTTLAQSTPSLAPITISLPQATNSIPCFNQNTVTNATSGNSLLKSSHNLLPTATTLEAPPIELPTIAVVKKTPVKAKEIVAEIKTRKFPHIPPKRALIINTPQEQLNYEKSDEFTTAETEPALGYSAWLEYVIETINDSIEISDETNVSHTFHVHEEIFSHFSKSFSIGIKRRMPNSTTIIKTGKHKGLIKYTWYFPTVATVRRIFSTKNIDLQIERAFEKTNDGDFVPYIRPTAIEVRSDGNKRRIFPKLALYMAHIWFHCNNDNHKTGFKLEWLPNAFPKSHFGILTIDFSLGIKDPFNIGSN